MRFHLLHAALSLFLGTVAFGTFSSPVLARVAVAPKTATDTQKRAITTALAKELGRATTNHVKVASWRLTSLEVRSTWALAGVKPSASSQLDPVTVLLHQRRGVWKVVTLGTNLRGSGAQFGVPRHLWKKWDLV